MASAVMPLEDYYQLALVHRQFRRLVGVQHFAHVNQTALDSSTEAAMAPASCIRPIVPVQMDLDTYQDKLPLKQFSTW